MVRSDLWGDGMAKKRMFSLTVCDTDRFLDLPSSAQSLYFHLGLRADDDGFVASPRRITAICGSTTNDLQLLVDNELVVSFESGVCAIKDWRVNNTIRSDRYTPTIYTCENALLMEQFPECHPNVNQMGDTLETQYRLDKISKDKSSSICTDTNFEIFWQAYPKKKDKAKAQKAFTEAIKKTDLDTMLHALEEQKSSWEWQKDSGQYIPLPTSWLNGCRWEDEAETEAFVYIPLPDNIPDNGW